jgi:hypothetical protein
MTNLAELHRLYKKCIYKKSGHIVSWQGNPEPLMTCACGGSFAIEPYDNSDAMADGLYHFSPDTRVDFLVAVYAAMPKEMHPAFIEFVSLIAPDKLAEFKATLGGLKC